MIAGNSIPVGNKERSRRAGKLFLNRVGDDSRGLAGDWAGAMDQVGPADHKLLVRRDGTLFLIGGTKLVRRALAEFPKSQLPNGCAVTRVGAVQSQLIEDVLYQLGRSCRSGRLSIRRAGSGLR